MEQSPSRDAAPRSPSQPHHDETPVTAPQTPEGGQTRMQDDAGSDELQLSNAAPDGDKVTDVPPFWTSRHGRSISTVSYHSISETRPSPISLEDRSDETHEQSLGCWAQSVSIDDYTIVSGPTGIGAYVVWHVTVGTLKGGDLELRKRYSEFDQLRGNLVRSFPHAEQMIPKLPRKSTVSRFRPEFLEQRRAGLSHFLNCVLLNSEFAASPVLKDFIFS